MVAVYDEGMPNLKLKTGKKAPALNAEGVLGERVMLTAYKDSYVLLAFMRYSGCPWCNLAIHRLSLECKILKKQNCKVIVVVQSSKENILENIYARHAVKPPYPIIADPEGDLYKKYHVSPSIKAVAHSLSKIPHWVHSVKKEGFSQGSMDGNFFMVPAWFLITPKTQKIAKAHYGSSYYEHETFTEVYELLFSGVDI